MAKKTVRTPYGERASWARSQTKLTQEDVAKRLGVRQSVVSDIETRNEASFYTAQLARIYGVDAYWLATGEGAPEIDDRTWRDIAEKIAFAQDISERGQRFAAFIKLVDQVADVGKAEQKLSGSGIEAVPADDRRDKRTKIKPDH